MADPDPRDAAGITAATAPRPLPPRVTTPLLTLITQQSLDEDYLHVAERRAALGGAPTRPGRYRGAAVALALFGLLVMTAVITTSRNASTVQAGRATLIQRIDDQRDTVDDLQNRIQRMRDQIAAGEAALTSLTATTVASQTKARRLQIRTGYLAVHGAGVRITVTDPTDPGSDDDLVQDADLRRLINGLWQAGAEAISINGQRLSVLSAIRNSGPVINVNYQALRSPYVVLAIGDPRTLQANLLASDSGAEFAGLVRQYGFGFTMQNVEAGKGLSLPSAPKRKLRSARPIEETLPPDTKELDQ